MSKIAIAALLSAFVAAPAVAADFYAGVKLGSVNYRFRNVTNNGQTGFGVLGGYTISENFAVEIEYNSLGGFDSSGGTIKGSSVGFSGIGFLPLNQQFSLFGKLGMASSTLKDTAQPGFSGGTYTYNNTGLTVGFGGQLNVSPEVGIRVGYDIYPISDAVSTSSAGMMYVGGMFQF